MSRLTCVGSCHGLVCLTFLDYTHLLLINPTTRRFNVLPQFVTESSSPPALCHYGFGFDKSSGDYKVVGFESLRHPLSDHIVRVYTPKSGRWTRIKNHYGRWKIFNKSATFATGKLHWIVTPTSSRGGYFNPNKLVNSWDIAYLDMETEEYGMLHKPEFVENGTYCNLVCSQGCLYAYCLLPKGVDDPGLRSGERDSD